MAEREYTKEEEELEIQSLRRIISAYLKYTPWFSIPQYLYYLIINGIFLAKSNQLCDHSTDNYWANYFLHIYFQTFFFTLYYVNAVSYPDAAEKDVRRYERSFKKLPPAHKVVTT